MKKKKEPDIKTVFQKKKDLLRSDHKTWGA